MRFYLQSSVFRTLVLCLVGVGPAQAQPSDSPQAVRIVAVEGLVQLSLKGTQRWLNTTTNDLGPGDRVRTGPTGRATLRWSRESTVRLGPGALVEILPPHAPRAQHGLHLLDGLMSFFHRDPPGRIRVIAPGADAIIDGTEFVIAAESVSARATLFVIDGRVRLLDASGPLLVTNLQQALTGAGRKPEYGPGFVVNNVLQWALHYPAVLDPDDLPLTGSEQQALADSLAAYRQGDVPSALARYPEGRTPESDAERVYYAALLLAVGQVEETGRILGELPVNDSGQPFPRLANAVRTLIAAVKRQPAPGGPDPRLASEFLAASYWAQSRATGDDSLRKALEFAREAANRSTNFGLAWARIAELQFSFGFTGQAAAALDRGLALAPRNAAALALKGFLLTAENEHLQALQWFNRAIDTEPSFGDAWLGRGLCRIRLQPTFFSCTPGEGEALDDLLIAASLEPQRALLRSYLGKAFAQAGDPARARHELDLARKLDPADPTPWLYSALLARENNRINEGVTDLERSILLNDNRALYRSRFRLDEDQAVRSANLARIYQDAGMEELSRHEASRAVSYDYANHSAHRFLAESFEALRDPTRFNLRYETVWFNELLLANLLSPADAGLLSSSISQNEYSRLFENNRVGLNSVSEYRSDGQYRQLASQFGLFGNTAWSLDLDYQHNNGIRPNNELDRLEWYSTVKQQLTPRDSVTLFTKYQDYHSGDNRQLYDAAEVARNFTFDETQQPLIYGGYHHEWGPGIHTLLLAGRLINDQKVQDRNVTAWLYTTNAAGMICTSDFNGNACVNAPVGFTNFSYRSQFETFPIELNQIVQGQNQILNLGGRVQFGQFTTRDVLDGVRVDPSNSGLFSHPPADDRIEEEFRRISIYAYYTHELWSRFLLTVGLAYDDMSYPANYRFAPITPGTMHRTRWLPKAAVDWAPAPEVQLRGIYSQAAGGVTFDESFRLEPSQLAGFSQAYRTLISESEAGSVAGATFEIFGAALDVKLKTRTYLELSGQLLRQQVNQDIGVFYFSGNDAAGLPPQIAPGPLLERLRYQESSAAVAINQLLGSEWAVGARYRFSDSILRTAYPDVPAGIGTPRTNPREEAQLHQIELFILYNHPSGFFARGESRWYWQHNTGYATARPGDEFAQFNLFAGYRFRRSRGEATLGVLNLGGEDYHLNSLNPYSELPHERVFLARLRLNF